MFFLNRFKIESELTEFYTSLLKNMKEMQFNEKYFKFMKKEMKYLMNKY
jgi:hypothetical protein